MRTIKGSTDLPLPVAGEHRGTAPTYRAVRARRIAEAHDYHRQRRLSRSHDSATWDSHRERAFLKTLTAVPTPAPLVSVIMPTLNQARSLERAIHSVLNQSYRNWELIVVSDGSIDNTDRILATLAAKEARIRIIAGRGIGVSAARNDGIAAAQGTIIAFLDSDNAWFSEMLDRSVAAMHTYDVKLGYYASRLDRDGGFIYRGMDSDRSDLLEAGNCVDINSLVLDRSLIVGAQFDETIPRWVGYEFLLRVTELNAQRYFPFLGVDYDERTIPGRLTTTEPASWEDVVLSQHRLDWSLLAADASARTTGAVSVVMLTYLDWRMTLDAVLSVLDRSGPRLHEVIIIDNGSNPHVGSTLRAALDDDPRVRILRQARNLNFALGNAVGFSATRSQYLVTLNNDTIVDDGWLDPLVDALEDDPTLLAVQPLLLYPDGTIQTAGTIADSQSQRYIHDLVGVSPATISLPDQRIMPVITAAAMCMRAKLFIDLQGFDPIFRNGLEDVDLCLRAAERHGGRFAVVSASRVTHFEGSTPGRRNHLSRNRELFLSRWLIGTDNQATRR